MNSYRCFDIIAEDGVAHDSCVVFVPTIELSKPEDRYENLVAITGALETLVGPVETFSYSEEIFS